MWSISNSVSVEKKINVDEEWSDFKKVLNGNSQLKVVHRKSLFLGSSLWWIAAAVVLLITISSVVLVQINSSPRLITVVANSYNFV